MGFRTTFVSQDLYLGEKQWPTWLTEKYGTAMFEGATISTNYELKIWPNYGYRLDLWVDIQAALIEMGYFNEKWDFMKTVRIICHNEDNSMILVTISQDEITATGLRGALQPICELKEDCDS
jgi:hypothetical protein